MPDIWLPPMAIMVIVVESLRVEGGNIPPNLFVNEESSVCYNF